MIDPIGIQSFEDLRKRGFVYVDKTARIYELATQGKYYFLSRPRRFGKSLLISTMEAYFKGQKELFKGLALEQLEKDWTEYPVLHLDLNTGEFNSKEHLYNVLNDTLGFPNQEVERRFTQFLLPYYMPTDKQAANSFITRFVKSVRLGDPETFLSLMQTMFEDNNYQVQGKMELYFQNCMYLIFRMMGFYTEVEHCTARGRIDVVVKTADYIYVIEVKLDGSADEALQQIEEKGYASPFAHDGRKVYKVGVNFSSELKGIAEWKIVS